MGRCKNCPVFTAIEGANEIVDGFDAEAIDDARKPGHEILKRNRMYRAVFDTVAKRIHCEYDNGPEDELPEPEPVAIEQSETVEKDVPSAQETEETDATTESITVPDDGGMAALIAALQAAKSAPKKACVEPFNEELNLLSLNNGAMTVFPDGHMEHESIREKKTKDKTDTGGTTGQYL